MRRLGLLALLVIAAIGAGAGWLDSQISRPYRGHRPEKVFVDIPHGTSRWDIAGILRHDDVIRNRLAFALLSFWHVRDPMQAGEYYFDHPVTSREVFWQLAQGRIFVRTVTLPEGWTMFDIAAELDREGVCTREDFLAATEDASLISDLAPEAHNLEGFLFPSTYQFTRHTTCQQTVKRMVQNFRAVWESLNSPAPATPPVNLTPSQIVTLASLVERETPQKDERPLVAGVFYNRLKKGGTLQCDPTVAYALELLGHPVKIVHSKDLEIDSPYNTYKYPGLPPGPIANPGEASLRAALLPSQTDYLFFVANDNGGHFFSKTLAEHNRNVARYRRLLSGETPAVTAQQKTPHRGPS
ncbi:MAG: endolytic transglycosylase MltG [Candidatus Acidiferrales bacterium]